MNIVLFSPSVPPNTGEIARTCVIANAKLHIIKPITFSLDEKHVKRLGLDYWDRLDLTLYEDFQDFLQKAKPDRIVMATTKTKTIYSDFDFKPDEFIMFGNESRGIPEEILLDYKESCVRIPMFEEERSLKLPHSVAIVLFEALRQNDFLGLNSNGDLHHLSWE